MFVPDYPQTLVLPLGAEAVVDKINAHISNVKERQLSKTRFTGTVHDYKFELMPHQRASNSFIPVIKGEILPCSQGSIIMTEYKLSRNTNFFLMFICILCLSISMIVLISQQNVIKCVWIFLIGTFNYLFTLFQFKREVDRSAQTFNQLFEIDLERKDNQD